VLFRSIGDNIYGCSLPSAVNNADAYDTALQAVYFAGTRGQDGSAPVNYPGYSFFSIVMDQNKNSDGHNYGYTLGWADDTAEDISGLFIARFQTKTGPNPTIQLRLQTDVLSNISVTPCYDLWTTVKKPFMWLDSQHLYVAVTGRCAYIIRVTLPSGILKPFAQSVYQLYNPAPSLDEYLSSAARDPQTNILYMAIQGYDRRTKPKVISFNLNTFSLTNAPTVEIDSQGYAKTILTLGIDGAEHNLFALAAGSTEAYRYTTDATGALTMKGVATLPPNFTDIGSAVFVGSYLYFTTYTPDASLARLHKNASFCKTYCGQTGFCNLGDCDCQTPWKKVYKNGTLFCENPKVWDIINKEVANEAAAVTFGVFFAFALLAAMTGWFLWWRAKSTSYQSL